MSATWYFQTKKRIAANIFVGEIVTATVKREPY